MERSGSFRRIDNNDTENLTNLGNNRAEVVRKRSMVKPERRRLDPDHPQFHYHNASQLPGVNVYPSSTGHDPHVQAIPPIPEDATYQGDLEEGGGLAHTTSFRSARDLHRDASRRTLRTGPEPNAPTEAQVVGDDDNEAANTGADDAFDFAAMHETTAPYMPKEKGISLWAAYCKTLTCFVRPWMMRPFGMKTPERQMAWREKIGLISVIILVGTFVGYLTFGFTESVCDNNQVRIHFDNIPTNNLVVSGAVYDVGQYYHPTVLGFNESVILYPPVNAGGKDASFMFQNVNGNCLDLITPKDDSPIPHDGNKLAWYFPCQIINPNNMTLVPIIDTLQDNNTKVYNGYGCHTHNSARDVLYTSKNHTADVYYTWDDLESTDKHLVVYNGDVLNLDYLTMLQTDDLDYPRQFDELRNDDSIRGQDITQRMAHGTDRKVAMCLREITKVGVIDTEPIGCIASKVVLYVSLVFIVGLVGLKFLLACYFRFFVARRQGAFEMTNKEYLEREQRIEDWGENIYSPAPYSDSAGMKERRSVIMEKLTQPKGAAAEAKATKRITMSVQNPSMSTSKVVPGGSIYSQPLFRQSAMYPSSAMSFNESPLMTANTAYRGAEPEAISINDMTPPYPPRQDTATPTSFAYSEPFGDDQAMGPVGGDEEYLVPQPPLDYQPYGFPLAHAMCLVTAYSESVEGLRTTLDSIATTDYPNSHKLITIICDGLIKGSGNDMSTPEICLSMMTDFAEEPDQVGAYSYVSVVSGAKRHNMAKVYAGFYKYDNSTVPIEKQQRVPVICIVKCGTPEEAHAAKPGNRGKRDSQIILMSFLQRIMFDERMTELEFEIFNGIRSVTGIAPDFYEVMLMVDADTKVYPDSITHMVGEMVRDPHIIGLCGETKIANKRDSWVTAIQVFEYFISHHQAKAFESVFGNVTCLPGCFSMYRIKAPKGMDGYWLPILCNPDIVERYADNVIDTLHKKNLLLLGEDRYLSTLMLRTFPSRKMVFVPKAACKTIVPDKFKVLLSQRRRWINSTIHNLMELVLVRDLCGVFIISMQFVVFIDLVSTLVLPAAISFTIYIIIIAIVKKPTPVLSLVLLALILGLPGLLIVVTAARVSYVLWMLIYLLALPVWNFILPMYAYWKFDDFSWGETRTIEGGDKGGHDEVNGEFDASHIQMKRWREFQETRATQAYDPYGTGAKSSEYSQFAGTPSGTPSFRSS